MAWVAVDNFDSYSDGDLNGNNGGTGWAAAWSGSTNYDIQGTTTYQGAKAVKNSTAATGSITRQLTTGVSDSGILYIAIRRSVNNAGEHRTNIRNQSNQNSAQIIMDASANIYIGVGGTTATIVSGYSTDTWYLIRLTFDVSTDTYTGAYHTGSAWSSESSSVPFTNTATSINYIAFDRSADAGDNYWDIVTGASPIALTTSVSDSLTMTEALTNIKGFFSAVSDAIGLTETVTNIRALIKSVTDAIGLTESSTVKGLWTDEDEVTTNWTDET